MLISTVGRVLQFPHPRVKGQYENLIKYFQQAYRNNFIRQLALCRGFATYTTLQPEPYADVYPVPEWETACNSVKMSKHPPTAATLRFNALYEVIFSDHERLLVMSPRVPYRNVVNAPTALDYRRTSGWDAASLHPRDPVKQKQYMQRLIQRKEIATATYSDARRRSELFFEPFKTSQELLDIAQQAREKNNTTSAKNSSGALGRNYWLTTTAELHQLMLQRKLLKGTAIPGQKWHQVFVLQLYDALNGIDPAVDTAGASKYHGLSTNELRALATEFGGSKHLCVKGTMQELIEWLINNAQSLNDVSDADAAAIIQAIKELNPNAFKDQSTSSIPWKETYHKKLVGPENALQSLKAALVKGLQPNLTSNVGLLCGPRGMATSKSDFLDGLQMLNLMMSIYESIMT